MHLRRILRNAPWPLRRRVLRAVQPLVTDLAAARRTVPLTAHRTRPAGPGNVPAQASGKNNRRLIQETFGRMLTKRMRHTPHPSRRSVLAEIEQRFAGPVAATAAHQFRHPDDLAVLSSLQQYYGHLTGRAVPGEIHHNYADLAAPSAPFRLARLLRDRHLDAFCLNDVDADAPTSREQAGLVADFLPAYLPFRAPFELASPLSRRKVTLTWEYV